MNLATRDELLARRLLEERIGGRKAWGLYVELMVEVRRQVSLNAERRIAEVHARTTTSHPAGRLL